MPVVRREAMTTLEAHRKFSAECFNATWKLLDKKRRTREDDNDLVSAAHASLWHWKQRSDCQSRNLSIGYWLLSRVYAVVGQPDYALHFAKTCLRASRHESPFYLGYAHEALARAYGLAGDTEHKLKHIARATALARRVADQEERAILELDLATIA